MKKVALYLFAGLLFFLFLALPIQAAEKVSPEAVVEKKQPVLKLEDELQRDTPRSTMIAFTAALNKDDYTAASNYLDFRYLPKHVKLIEEEELTRQLKLVLLRGATWIDHAALSNEPDGYSDDNLPAFREYLGRVKLDDDKSVDLLLQRVPGPKGLSVWKFSNRTVAQIPAMYAVHGYTEFEQQFVDVFPAYEILGWQLWQWMFALLLMGLFFVLVYIPTKLVAFLMRRNGSATLVAFAALVSGPIRFMLFVYLAKFTFLYVTPSATMRAFVKLQTLQLIILLWLIFKLIDIGKELIARRMCNKGQEGSIVLLQPAGTMLRITMAVLVALIWLDNAGVHIGTVLTGLGVGGIAFALAAQDTLKNLIGGVIIFLDKPFSVGQRILVNGHDGEVEEIGVRSTKMRLLNGHQVIVPNGEMARLDIENIDRRPHIRRRENIGLPYDTPVAKVTRAVDIIRAILADHDGMAKDKPAQVYFDNFKSDCLNIVFYYWYHPADYWNYLAFAQRVNEQIMTQFAAAGISFALPSQRLFLEQDGGPGEPKNL